jgi:hypothetical protein
MILTFLFLLTKLLVAEKGRKMRNDDCSFCHKIIKTVADHPRGCPELFAGSRRDAAILEFHRGLDARKRTRRPISSSDTYWLGYEAPTRFNARNQSVLFMEQTFNGRKSLVAIA